MTSLVRLPDGATEMHKKRWSFKEVRAVWVGLSRGGTVLVFLLLYCARGCRNFCGTAAAGNTLPVQQVETLDYQYPAGGVVSENVNVACHCGRQDGKKQKNLSTAAAASCVLSHLNDVM